MCFTAVQSAAIARRFGADRRKTVSLLPQGEVFQSWLGRGLDHRGEGAKDGEEALLRRPTEQ